MGGSGSTRWRNNQKKALAEESIPLELSKIAHRSLKDPSWSAGTFQWSVGGEPIATVRYAIIASDGEPAIQVTADDYREGQAGRLTQTFPLTAVKTFPGRSRLFAICPDCGGRMAKAYWPRGREGYACRKCSRVSYPSNQREDKRVNYFRKNPEACIAALHSGPLRRRMLAWEGLPEHLYPFCNRHPGGQRLQAAWGAWMWEKVRAGIEAALPSS